MLDRFCENAIARYFATGETPGPIGSRHPVSYPFQAFPTKDSYVVVAMPQNEEWDRFCRELDLADLAADPRFKTRDDRLEHHPALEPLLNELFRSRSTAEWLKVLTAIEIPCAPVHSIDQVVSDPQVQHREMIVERPQEGIGSHPFVNSPIRLDRTPGRVEQGAPTLGQHTDAVLREVLDLGEEEIESLQAKGIV